MLKRPSARDLVNEARKKSNNNQAAVTHDAAHTERLTRKANLLKLIEEKLASAKATPKAQV